MIQTDNWLQNYVANKTDKIHENVVVHMDTLCEPLVSYFTDTDAQTIQWHLLQHGLFFPDPHDKQIILTMIKRNYWRKVEEQFASLKLKWKGPEVPVLLFPSDFTNNRLQEEFSGLSGLSYPDKVFLFITDDTPLKKLEALLTHEYSHVYRLQYNHSKDKTLTLSDAIVLEGIAEIAVKKIVGNTYLSKAGSLHTKEEAQFYWNEWIKPNQHLVKTNAQHDRLMYGGEEIPKWAGYNVGFHLVENYMEINKISLLELLQTPTDTIIEKSGFPQNVR
ncbi:DUF2268 domain-containing protein [Paraliobacillus sediminis]|uniref:DUF2268 domain-containing protein n=1 Tax=Paraliobacillus sediminis TaxID=1885916 RepID=UPI000E3EDE55|nr:DUF2268 domain-containing putative Zn-dependent protease [Paraliobacillus sediminis]